MIEVAPNTAIMIYLALTLATIFGLWVYTHLIKRKEKVLTTTKQLLVCEYCQCAYVEDQSKEVTECPECHSYNKNNKYDSQ